MPTVYILHLGRLYGDLEGPCKPDHPQANGQVEQAHRRLEQVVELTKAFEVRHRRQTPTYNPGDQAWLATKDLAGLNGC